MRQLQAWGGSKSAWNLHLAVAFLTARVCGEGVRDVHSEHGLVEGYDVVSFCIDWLDVRASLFSSRAFSSAILFCVLARSKLRSVLRQC